MTRKSQSDTREGSNMNYMFSQTLGTFQGEFYPNGNATPLVNSKNYMLN